MDFVLVLFCLSAVSPELQPEIIRKAVDALSINGQLLLRDYGRWHTDMKKECENS